MDRHSIEQRIIGVLTARGLLRSGFPGRLFIRVWWKGRWIFQLRPEVLRRPGDLVRPEVVRHLRMALGGRRVVPYVGPEGVYLQVSHQPQLPPSESRAWNPRTLRPGTFPIGETGYGSLFLPFDEHPGVLVVGTTGSGKTLFLRTVVQAALYGGRSIVLIRDGKQGADFDRFRAWCRVEREADPLLVWVQEEMQRRFRQLGHGRFPRILLVVDEVTTLAREEQKLLGEVLTLGRAAGIRVFVATQYPRAQFLDGRARANMDTRIVFRVTDVQDSVTALGHKGAETLGYPGWAIVRYGGREVQVRTFLPLDDEAFVELMDRRWPAGYRWRPPNGRSPASVSSVKPGEGRGYQYQPYPVVSDSDLSEIERQVARAILERGGWCHIGEIAQALGISRHQVHKAALALEERGLLTPPLRDERGYVRGRRATPALYYLTQTFLNT